MPEFNPFAGFSPNCCAVRVHTEHWASTLTEESRKVKNKKKKNKYLCLRKNIVQIYGGRVYKQAGIVK